MKNDHVRKLIDTVRKGAGLIRTNAEDACGLYRDGTNRSKP